MSGIGNADISLQRERFELSTLWLFCTRPAAPLTRNSFVKMLHMLLKTVTDQNGNEGKASTGRSFTNITVKK